jgi:16S rRNA (cytidine1402-2'-O)-methyltransferase
MNHELEPGLYIVATPIGNLSDISERAIFTLAHVKYIACEDSRVTGKLLRHLDVTTPTLRYNDHSKQADRDNLLNLASEYAIALVSDAGTPLISDPGFKLVRAARDAGVAVHAVPGASAFITALLLSGLPSDRFLFAGFLPNKAKARDDALMQYNALDATLIFYESAQRLAAALAAMAASWPEREGAVIREITKKFEETRCGTLRELAAFYAQNSVKGEICIVIGPPIPVSAQIDDDAVQSALTEALETMSTGKAASFVAQQFSLERKSLYDAALRIKNNQQ